MRRALATLGDLTVVDTDGVAIRDGAITDAKITFPADLTLAERFVF